MSDAALLTEAEIDHMERRCAALVEDGRWDHAWTTHSIVCALATIRDLQANLADRDARVADAAAQISVLRAEVVSGREVLGVARWALTHARDNLTPHPDQLLDEALAKICALTGES